MKRNIAKRLIDVEIIIQVQYSVTSKYKNPTASNNFQYSYLGEV